MGDVICKDCAEKLQNSVAFKSSCLNTERKMLPFINSEADAKLVLKEEDELQNVSEDQKICRFCKILTEKGCYTFLQSENMFIVEMVQKFIPELNLKITEELITCYICLDSLQSFLNFIIDLLDVEEKIKQNVNRTEDQEKMDCVLGLSIKHEGNSRDIYVAEMKEENFVDREFVSAHNEIEGENQQLNIKNEEIEIKSEDNCDHSFEDTSQVNSYGSYIFGSHHTSHTITYKCKMCPYESKDEMLVNSRKSRKTADPHALTRDPLAVNIFKCDICSHETNRKGNLKLHMLTHYTPSDLRMYTCEQCLYVTDQKRSLKQHSIIHKDPSETKMYKCDKCPFESKHQHSLGRHISTHQNFAEIKIYRCESCQFQSKHESSLGRHLLIHRNPTEIKMYTCVICSYKAPQKDRLKRHMLIHQEPSEVTMYKCQKCKFETKRTDKLRRHELTHDGLEEVIAFKCEKCSYKSKRKDNLKQHMITHEKPLENKLYKCDLCPYVAKYKRCFDKHKETH